MAPKNYVVVGIAVLLTASFPAQWAILPMGGIIGQRIDQSTLFTAGSTTEQKLTNLRSLLASARGAAPSAGVPDPGTLTDIALLNLYCVMAGVIVANGQATIVPPTGLDGLVTGGIGEAAYQRSTGKILLDPRDLCGTRANPPVMPSTVVAVESLAHESRHCQQNQSPDGVGLEPPPPPPPGGAVEPAAFGDARNAFKGLCSAIRELDAYAVSYDALVGLHASNPQLQVGNVGINVGRAQRYYTALGAQMLSTVCDTLESIDSQTLSPELQATLAEMLKIKSKKEKTFAAVQVEIATAKERFLAIL